MQSWGVHLTCLACMHLLKTSYPPNHNNVGPHSYNSIENATHHSQPSHLNTTTSLLAYY